MIGIGGKFTELHAECNDQFNGSTEAYRNLTPDVRAGARIADAQIATDPSRLVRSASARDTEETDPVRPRAAPADSIVVHLGIDVDPIHGAPHDESMRQLREDRPPAGSSSDPLPPAGPASLEPTPADPANVVAAIAASAAFFLIIAALVAYSRYSAPHELLSSPPRRLILEQIRRNPGMDFRELLRGADVTRNGITYHLHRLERAGLVRITREGSRQFLWPADAPRAPTTDAPLALIRHPIARQVIEHVRLAGTQGIPRSRIHELVAAPRRTSNHVLSKLITAGLMAEENRGGHAMIKAT